MAATDKRHVYWIRTDDGSRPAPYTIETEGGPRRDAWFVVGVGDMLAYGRYGVTADLGVGLWAIAMPIDWDDDGEGSLYSCQDKPQGGVYLYIQEAKNVFRQVKARRTGCGTARWPT